MVHRSSPLLSSHHTTLETIEMNSIREVDDSRLSDDVEVESTDEEESLVGAPVEKVL